MALAQVIVLDSVNEDVFICGFCKLVFNSLQPFLDHKMKQCNKITIFKDDIIAQNSFNSTDESVSAASLSFVGEKQTLHKTGTLSKQTNNISCKFCNKEFKKSKNLHAHLKSHERPPQCPVCGRCFNNNYHLKRHITTHKVWPDGLNETTPKSSDVELLSYSCSYCKLVLSNYSQFRAHLNCHLTLKRFKCVQGECNCFFETFADLLSHVSNAHNAPKYTCHLCKMTFDSLEDISIHHQGHKEVKEDMIKCQSYKESKQVIKPIQIDKFKCSQCDATFRKRENLSLHLLTENHNKACIHCSKTFASDKRLRMHLQIHKKSKPFECSICGDCFHMKKYLSSHMLKHGESRFTCATCKFTFKRQDVLQRHMKTHQLRKSMKCPFRDVTGCLKEFNRRDKLTEHLKSHTKSVKSFGKKDKLVPPDSDSNTVEICIVPLEAIEASNTGSE